MAEDDRFTEKVGRLGIADDETDPEFPAITSGFGEPDFGAANGADAVSDTSNWLGVELDTELCRDLRAAAASSTISSALRRIGVFGADSVSRNLTNSARMLTSTFPVSAFLDGIMFLKYRRPNPGPSSPVLIRSSSSNPRTLAIKAKTSVFCFASAWNRF